MGDPPVLVASSRRARRELGWQSRHSKLEEMLTDAWAWKEAHPAGYGRAAGDTNGAAGPMPNPVAAGAGG
jgi:UDP-glucose 4-epimerase